MAIEGLNLLITRDKSSLKMMLNLNPGIQLLDALTTQEILNIIYYLISLFLMESLVNLKLIENILK
jgi:hypothetical protein